MKVDPSVCRYLIDPMLTNGVVNEVLGAYELCEKNSVKERVFIKVNSAQFFNQKVSSLAPR